MNVTLQTTWLPHKNNGHMHAENKDVYVVYVEFSK